MQFHDTHQSMQHQQLHLSSPHLRRISLFSCSCELKAENTHALCTLTAYYTSLMRFHTAPHITPMHTPSTSQACTNYGHQPSHIRTITAISQHHTAIGQNPMKPSAK
jgi:hypothetical protein